MRSLIDMSGTEGQKSELEMSLLFKTSSFKGYVHDGV